MPRKPDFIIAGAPKCGTTAMWRYLGAHPDVFMAPRKDLHYFGQDLAWQHAPRPSEAEYLAHFADAGEALRVGEASVWYLYSARAAEEMCAFNPDMRVVLGLRDPVDAVYSLHAQLLRNRLGDEDISDFAEALAAEPDRLEGRRLPKGTPLPSALYYRQAVRFGTQVARYQAVLGPDQVHVVLLEDWRQAPEQTWQGLCAFLELDPHHQPDFRVVNTNKAVRSEGLRSLIRRTPAGLKDAIPLGARAKLRKSLRSLNAKKAQRAPMDPDLAAQLRREFRPEVEHLAALIDRDLGHWMQPR